MSKSFKMSTINGGEVILPKDAVTMENGYGIVEAQDIFNLELEVVTYLGIVNKDYEEILPLVPKKLMPSVDIGLDDNIMFKAVKENGECAVFHIMVKDGYMSMFDTGAYNYYRLNEDIFVLFKNANGRDLATLYSASKGCSLLPFVDDLGPFVYNSKYDCRLAEAKIYSWDNDDVDDVVSFYIDETGKTITNYIEFRDGIEFMASMSIDEVLEALNKNKCR